MPGIAPSDEPSKAQRITSHQCVNVSRTPCHWPLRTSTFASSPLAMERRAIAMSASSGRAKRPIVTGTRGRPSQR